MVAIENAGCAHRDGQGTIETPGSSPYENSESIRNAMQDFHHEKLSNDSVK
jgi:hypothetical protein